MASAANNQGYCAARGDGALVTLVSARGGVGKSTLALILGHLSARHSIKTALLEADLQFGDMGFWLGLDPALSNLSQGRSCMPVPLADQLDLYKAPVFPELAEEICDQVAELIPQARARYDLVIADTGQFWSGLTGELLVSSDLVLLITEQRKSCIYGAIKALELCQRLGIARARIACVLNRASGLTHGELDRITDALDVETLHCLGDGRAAVETLVTTGRIEELVDEEGCPVGDASQLLTTLLPRVGIEFVPARPKRTRGLFR